MPPTTALEPNDPRWRRLSALDAAFLAIEGERNLLHIGATALFEPGSWVDENGRIDEARFLRHSEWVLRRLPKWRQRLARVPVLRHPVLVADPDFDLKRHVRFVHLEDATIEDVERVASELYSQMLDRSRPLWEICVVDGLVGRRFATVVKLHHCMADGIAGISALMAMLGPTPEAEIPELSAEPALRPPTRRELLRTELELRAREPRALWQRLIAARKHPDAVRSSARAAASGMISVVRSCARPAPKTPLNPRRVGAKRAYRGVRLDLDQVKAVRRAAGAKLNEVVLATVAAATQRYFAERGAPIPERDLRCMVPVSLHDAAGIDSMGNEVSLMIVPLPIAQMGARERLQRIVDWSKRAKEAGQSGAFALGESFAEWTFAPLIPWAMRLVVSLRPYNIIVTNIPGPSVPFYLGDAELIGIYPLVPLYGNQALAIALVSYNGSLFWGLNADPDRIDDLGALGAAIRDAFAELREAYVEPTAVGRAAAPAFR